MASSGVGSAGGGDADRVPVIVEYLKERIPAERMPSIAIVCGSGLGHLSDTLEDSIVFRYEDIPLFPQSTVNGHKSELVLGRLSGREVLLMKGRFHMYEGYTPAMVATPIRVMAALGVRVLIVTNAAGGVDPAFRIGDVMVMDDHLFFPGVAGFNPLVGRNDERFGTRFPSMSEPFSKALQKVARDAAEGLRLGERMRYNGVYCCVSGPSYETRHEIEMLRTLGGQAVGMSTIQEVVVANHAGMAVLGLSVITNRCKGPGDDFPSPTHEEVLTSIKSAEPHVQALVKTVVGNIDADAFEEPIAAAYFREHPLKPEDRAAALAAGGAGGGGCCTGGSCCGGSWSTAHSIAAHATVAGLVAAAAYLLMRKR